VDKSAICPRTVTGTDINCNIPFQWYIGYRDWLFLGISKRGISVVIDDFDHSFDCVYCWAALFSPLAVYFIKEATAFDNPSLSFYGMDTVPIGTCRTGAEAILV
jgi:hypothetical protein